MGSFGNGFGSLMRAPSRSCYTELRLSRIVVGSAIAGKKGIRPARAIQKKEPWRQLSSRAQPD